MYLFAPNFKIAIHMVPNTFLCNTLICQAQAAWFFHLRSNIIAERRPEPCVLRRCLSLWKKNILDPCKEFGQF